MDVKMITDVEFMITLFLINKANINKRSHIAIIAPHFTQAKNLFLCIDDFYEGYKSIRKFFKRKPMVYADVCIAEFKNDSEIRTMSLGDWARIKGHRFDIILAYNFEYIPSEIMELIYIQNIKYSDIGHIRIIRKAK